MLSKYFKPMSTNYIGNYFFEIDEGFVFMCHFVITPDSDMELVATVFLSNIDSIRKYVLFSRRHQ